ncbi:hypothetical protein [Streptomyces sp. NPDC088748]|uniref:hypothetical protein n=1 Tax=Streptomyces sp. NPDC088748 TaxID=3365887 RepID=UPI00380D2AED
MFLDATYVEAPERRIVSLVGIIATGATEDGGREVAGVMVGEAKPIHSGPSSCFTCENAARRASTS